MLNDLLQISKYLIGIVLALIVLPTKWFIADTNMSHMSPKNGVKDGVNFLNEMKDAFNSVESTATTKVA